MQNFTQKTNEYINKNNLIYSIELFNTIYNLIKNDKNNIIQEQIRVLKLNNNPINNNYNLLNNMCYSKNKNN